MKGNTTQTTIRLPTELKAILEDKADRLGISFNAVILLALWEAAKRE